MIVKLVTIPSLQFEKVHYYSVRLENRNVSEYRDFQLKMSGNDEKDRIELAEINRYIERIGEEYSATTRHFKVEDAAERLPPPYHRFIEGDFGDYGLRLYCIRLTPYIVILLNGDRKTALKVQDCAKCYSHFDKARKLAKQMTEAIEQGYISIDEENKEIVFEDDEFEFRL